MALKFNTFRAQRYLRSKFVEGKFLLASEATDLELEILDILRQQVKELFGEAVAVEDAWKVERLNDTQLLIKPGEAWVEGLPFVMRGGKDQLVSGTTLSIGTVPVGVSVADDASGLGKVLTFNDGATTPSSTYKLIVTAREELITEVQDPFLQNVNLTESTQQKIRLVFQINIVPASIQTESPVPYRDESSVATDSGLTPTNFPDTGSDNQPNFVNKIVVTPTVGVGELLSTNAITGSEGIDGKDLELIIANPLGNNPIPNNPTSQAAFSNGTLIDSNGTHYHINFITNDAVGGQVKIVIDKEYQQANPVIDAPGGRSYTIVKRAVFVTDDVNGVPQGRSHWPVADIVWSSANGFVHTSSVQDLRKVVKPVQQTQETLADKLDLFLVAGGNLSWDAGTGLLTWSSALKLVSPYGPTQTISAASMPIVDGGSLIYEMDLASGGAIERGTLAVASTSTGTSITLTGSPDLSDIRVGNVVVDDNGNLAAITAIDDVNDTLTVDSALTFTAAGTIYLDSYAAQTAPKNVENFVLAVRDGSKVYIGINDLELESGETNQLGDGISSQNLTYIGATSEADEDPNYSSVTVVTQGGSLTQAIGELDAGLDALTTVVGDIQWKAPVADFATLPAVGNVDGDVRLVLDTRIAYHWKDSISEWVPLTGSGSSLKIIGGGTVSWDDASDEISFTEDMYVEKSGLDYVDNTIPVSESPITLTNDKDVAYVEPNLIEPNSGQNEFTTDYSTPFASQIAHVAKVIGTRLYTSHNSSFDLKITNVSDPEAPVLTNALARNDSVVAGAIFHDPVSNRIGIRYNRSSPSVITASLSDPDNLTDVQNAGTAWQSGSAQYRAVAYRNNIIYTAGATNTDPRIYIYDVSGGSAVTLTSVLYTSFTSGNAAQKADFSVDGNTLYVAAGQQLHIFDVTTPASTTSYTSLAMGGEVGEVIRIAANYVAVPVRGTNNLHIVDVSNPSAPVIDNTLVLPGTTQSSTVDTDTISFDGTYLIISKSSNEINIVDVSVPTAPTVTDTLATPSATTGETIASETLNFLGSIRDNGSIDFWQTINENQLSVVVDTLPNVPPTAVVIARRDGNDVIVGSSSTRLKDGQSTELYAQDSDQTLSYLGATNTADAEPTYSSDIRGTANESLTARAGVITDALGDSQEDRSAYLRSDEPVTWTGTQLQFTTDIVLEVINTKSGTVKTATVQTASSPIALNNGESAWVSIDRTTASENLTVNVSDTTAIPAQSQADKDVIVLARRQDALGAGYLHLPLHKQVLEPGQTVRLGASGAGAGNANEITETTKNRLLDSTFEAATPIVFELDTDTLVDGASTGAYSLVKKKFEFTGVGETLVSVQMADAEFLASEAFLNTCELLAFWSLDAIDTGATYEVSRNGGQEWQAVTMERLADTELYRGYHTFDEEAANQSIDSQPSSAGNYEIDPTTASAYGQEFTVTNTTEIRQLDLDFSKTGSPTGGFTIKLVKDDLGLPSLDPNDLLAETNVIDIGSLATGVVTLDLPKTVLQAGTYHFVLTVNQAYTNVFSTGVTALNVAFQGASSGLAELNLAGDTWVDQGVSWKYDVKGIEYDLRIRITSSAAAELSGVAILYDEQIGGIVTGQLQREVHAFKAVADNLNEFTLTSMVPDPNLLRVYYVESGQVFAYPAFSLQGNKVVFEQDQFNNNGIEANVTLVFDQTRGGAFDNSDLNGLLLANNHLGSTDPAVDKSAAGRGIQLRSPNNTLWEIKVQNDGSILTEEV